MSLENEEEFNGTFVTDGDFLSERVFRICSRNNSSYFKIGLESGRKHKWWLYRMKHLQLHSFPHKSGSNPVQIWNITKWLSLYSKVVKLLSMTVNKLRSQNQSMCNLSIHLIYLQYWSTVYLILIKITLIVEWIKRFSATSWFEILLLVIRQQVWTNIDIFLVFLSNEQTFMKW